MSTSPTRPTCPCSSANARMCTSSSLPPGGAFGDAEYPAASHGLLHACGDSVNTIACEHHASGFVKSVAPQSGRRSHTAFVPAPVHSVQVATAALVVPLLLLLAMNSCCPC